MNRIVIILAVSAAVCAAAVGQTSSNVFSLYADGDRGWLGVSVQDVTKKLAERENLKAATGAYVSDVVDDSPAEAAGILEGDVIVKFGAKEIDDSDDLIRAVRKSEPGDEVAIVVRRGADSKNLMAKLDEMETPRAFTFTVPHAPGVPRIAPGHPRTPGLGFFRSGERLGMEMQDLGRQLAEFFEVPGNRGVLVTSVAKKGAAAKAGMQAGDIIVSVNDHSVRDVDDVLDEIRDADGETVPFEVIRKGKPVTMSVEVDRDDDPTSHNFDLGRREFREALKALTDERAGRREMLHGLRESLKELKEELRENARELREKLREELRSY